MDRSRGFQPSPSHWLTPWAAPTGALAAAGLSLGRDYPQPMVDHGEARAAALAAWQAMRDRR